MIGAAVSEPPSAPVAEPVRRKLKINNELLSRSKAKRQAAPATLFKIGAKLHPPGVASDAVMAMDDDTTAINAWAFQNISAILNDGQTFLGYPLLAELAQRPEYRRITETIARHMTRKWIEFDVKTDGDGAGGDKAKRKNDNKEAAAEVEAEADDEDAAPFGASDLAFGNGSAGSAAKEGSEPVDPASNKPEKSLAPDQDKLDKVAKLEERLEEIGAKHAFYKIAEQDGFFGRSHLYVDLDTTDDPAELKTPIGNGSDETTEMKLKNKAGALKILKPVEAVWCYPTNYNSNNPLKSDWYSPKSWFVMGTELDASRLLTFIGREVPDILKPAYSFGGLALSQMVKPYVENWINTRQAVASIVRAFSIFVLKTKLTDALETSGDELFSRVELFNNFRDNSGTFVIDKDDEDFANVSASLSSLDKLQAQAQEQMASIAGIPIVLLLMITPSGLNASSEGEIQAFWDWVHSYQESFFRTHLTTVINMLQISEFGEVDPDITWTFARLEGLNDLEWSQKELAQAQTDTAYVDAGIIDPIEVRKALVANSQSRYHGLDVDDVPEPPEPELPPGLGSLVSGAAKAKPAESGAPGTAAPKGVASAAVKKPEAAKKELAG